MDPRDPAGRDGSSPPASTPPPRRRLSMDEDLFYHQIMTASPRRPSNPPPYQQEMSSCRGSKGKGKVKDKVVQAVARGVGASTAAAGTPEALPNYSNSIAIEGVFSMKHEIENTTKRAEDRQWHTVFVALNGTALNIHKAKKDWGWGRTRDGPAISPDSPPWMRKSKLEKSYSLLYADAGIAADYRKRRYVIRIRAETDQFLLSCVELSTFVKWLELLFAAIDIAAPIDDRDFPRDMSIPRIQRIRWFRGQSPTRIGHASSTNETQGGEEGPSRELRRRSSSPELTTDPMPVEEPLISHETDIMLNTHESVEQEVLDSVSAAEDSQPATPPRREPVHRFSTTSYPNMAIDPYSGKWLPEHGWTTAHDMLYAKLCYSTLFFRSPRKSNYIISKGKEWFVDWATGRMVRVLPPAYGEVDYFGPWQVVHTENPRI